MENVEYAIAYKEVFEILKYIPNADYNKIPKEKIELYKTMQDKNYNFKYNPSKTLDEQNVSKRAKAIIGLLFRDYWATPEQREKIIRVQQQERIRIEKERQEKYKPNELFSTKKEKETQEFALVEVKEEKWYKKIFDFFRNLFKR